MTEPLNIYVIGSTSGPFKIGVAKNPRARRSEIQIGSHTRIEVVYSVAVPGEDALLIERGAHRILREHRLSGEWFNVTKDQAEEAIREAIVLSKYKQQNLPLFPITHRLGA